PALYLAFRRLPRQRARQNRLHVHTLPSPLDLLHLAPHYLHPLVLLLPLRLPRYLATSSGRVTLMIITPWLRVPCRRPARLWPSSPGLYELFPNTTLKSSLSKNRKCLRTTYHTFRKAVYSFRRLGLSAIAVRRTRPEMTWQHDLILDIVDCWSRSWPPPSVLTVPMRVRPRCDGRSSDDRNGMRGVSAGLGGMVFTHRRLRTRPHSPSPLDYMVVYAILDLPVALEELFLRVHSLVHATSWNAQSRIMETTLQEVRGTRGDGGGYSCGRLWVFVEQTIVEPPNGSKSSSSPFRRLRLMPSRPLRTRRCSMAQASLYPDFASAPESQYCRPIPANATPSLPSVAFFDDGVREGGWGSGFGGEEEEARMRVAVPADEWRDYARHPAISLPDEPTWPGPFTRYYCPLRPTRARGVIQPSHFGVAHETRISGLWKLCGLPLVLLLFLPTLRAHHTTPGAISVLSFDKCTATFHIWKQRKISKYGFAGHWDPLWT
ncbi:hypothetical protein C8F01DRAFT_1343291, partial [Mycena amicta]